MYVTVRLLSGFDRLLTYRVPDVTRVSGIARYQLVQVPLRTRTEFGYIVEVMSAPPSGLTCEIREISASNLIQDGVSYGDFIARLAQYYVIEPTELFGRIKQYLAHAIDHDSVLVDMHEAVERGIETQATLTDTQRDIVDHIHQDIGAGRYAPHLIFGVTGSGKSEIYIAAIRDAYAQGLSTLFLLPEVTLAVQFQHLFAARLPEIPLLSLHSATSSAHKRLLWKHMQAGHPTVIVGVHMPVMLPLARLGLIIVDEEHEAGYQEKKHPKINTKEAALMRAHSYGIPIILGSATPTVQTFHTAAERGWRIHRMTERFRGAFPVVRHVVLRAGDGRPHAWVSRELFMALKECLMRGEQALIFLNRRGHCFSVECRACHTMVECTACSVSLTLHTDKIAVLRCHYCGYTRPYIPVCGNCGAPEKELIKKGVGTQQLVTILQKLLPAARIARADLDATINRSQWVRTVHDMSEGRLDILVGTQTISKGYHFPRVTLVGIVWAESSLHIPSYLSTEHTVQQLIQVAGRAGREISTSTVIVQSFVAHPLFDYLTEQRYEQFIAYEREARAQLGYPPYGKFAEIELKHENEELLKQDVTQCAARLRTYARTQEGMIVRGPVPPPVYKVQHVYRQRLLITAPTVAALQGAYRYALQGRYASVLFFTPNPSD